MLRYIIVAVVLVTSAHVEFAAAQTPTRTTELSNVVNADNRVADGRAADGAVVDVNSREAAEEAYYDKAEMTLTPDGTIPGNLRVFDENGALVPARVKLFFLQNGQVVSQSMPSEQGDFQISGLSPGTYSVVAAGQSGFAALGVRVLPPPNRPEAPKANTIGKAREVSQPLGLQFRMNVPLIQPVDVRAAFQLASQQNAGGLGSFPGGFGNLGSGATAAAAGAGGGGGAVGAGLSPALTRAALGALVGGGVAGALSGNNSSDDNESSVNGSGS